MPPFEWSIKIKEDPDKKTRFVPDTLEVEVLDTVSWGNWTKQAHHPWPTKANGDLLTDAEVTGANAQNYLSGEIPGQQSSSPAWVAAASTITDTTIFYCCKLHPGERGKIIITP